MKTFVRKVILNEAEFSLYRTLEGFFLISDYDPYVSGTGKSPEEAAGDMLLNNAESLLRLMKAGKVGVGQASS